MDSLFSTALATTASDRTSDFASFDVPVWVWFALVGAIGFHALNGLRIILVDFWGVGTRHQKAMFYVVLGVWLVETYRGQFAQEINAKGLGGLITTQSERNKANAKKG